jgi:hypothetical protein
MAIRGSGWVRSRRKWVCAACVGWAHCAARASVGVDRGFLKCSQVQRLALQSRQVWASTRSRSLNYFFHFDMTDGHPVARSLRQFARSSFFVHTGLQHAYYDCIVCSRRKKEFVARLSLSKNLSSIVLRCLKSWLEIWYLAGFLCNIVKPLIFVFSWIQVSSLGFVGLMLRSSSFWMLLWTLLLQGFVAQICCFGAQILVIVMKCYMWFVIVMKC